LTPAPLFIICLAYNRQVIFEGETTWGYEEWDGPLLQIEGSGISIQGASGAYLNPDGARWWDGKGGSGGKTKPKFFYAHSLTDSTITNLHIQNTPIQAVSINGASGLTITDMTIDDSAGDSEGGHNTDGFDIGSSTNVVITGANVYNQDDCVAINSGTVCRISSHCNNTDAGTSPSQLKILSAPGAMACPSVPLEAAPTTLLAILRSQIMR
jgi:polygalacturonase